jgi:hypothetical protein
LPPSPQHLFDGVAAHAEFLADLAIRQPAIVHHHDAVVAFRKSFGG